MDKAVKISLCLIALILPVLWLCSIFTITKIEGSSMYPNFYPDDYVLMLRKKVEPLDVLPVKFKTETRLKRVVAFEGSRVQYKFNELYIDGKKIEKQLNQSEFNDLFTEIHGDKKINITDTGSHNLYDNTKEFVVPPGKIFVLGDNRDNSGDSRMDIFPDYKEYALSPYLILFSIDAKNLSMRTERFMMRTK